MECRPQPGPGQEIYEPFAGGSGPGLVGYWNFDKDEGDIIKNSTAYLNNGIAGKLLWDI